MGMQSFRLAGSQAGAPGLIGKANTHTPILDRGTAEHLERSADRSRLTASFIRRAPDSLPRLFYLGFAFPPGVAALHLEINPAGHAIETQMIGQLRRFFDVRSAGVLPFAPPKLEAADPASGLAHELVLVEKPPEMLHRVRSVKRLKAEYLRWRATGWEPDMLLVYNLSPIYNHFLLWLRQQPRCPKLVLLLLDSATLGRLVPWLKRFRHRFKPMSVPDAEMLPYFNACVGLSRHVQQYFADLQIPFLWMPGGCCPQLACSEPNGFAAPGDQKRLGYFGALGPHAGVRLMVETFLGLDLPATLEICGYGKAAAEIEALSGKDQRVKFRGLVSPAECLHFGHSCDLLINPRPATHGNENNFASKLFDYALTGRAILTAKLSGVEAVLGPEALYFDPRDFQRSLREQLIRAVMMPRAELHQRGNIIRQRLVTEFSWERQGARLAQFLQAVFSGGSFPDEIPAALAA